MVMATTPSVGRWVGGGERQSECEEQAISIEEGGGNLQVWISGAIAVAI